MIWTPARSGFTTTHGATTISVDYVSETTTTIAALCKCGNYIAIVSSAVGRREIDHFYHFAAKADCQVVEIAYDDAKPRFGPCECGKQPTRQLPLFDQERT